MFKFNTSKKRNQSISFIDSVIDDEDVEFYNEGNPNGYWTKERILDYEMYMYYTDVDDEQ